MDWGTIAQVAVTALIATATTLLVQARQERERVSCFIDWRYSETPEGIDDNPYLGVHNRSAQPIAVHSARWVVNGFFMRRHIEGTALAFEDPFDLNFPYIVAPGAISSLVLDGHDAKRYAAKTTGIKAALFSFLGMHRILIEVRTTAQTRLLVPAEAALPWDTRIWSARL
jgi:hypothetical protein